MSFNSDIHQDLYVRITYSGINEPTITPDKLISILQEYRTWNVEGMLKTIRERHESATVTQIDYATYLKELHREPHSN